MLTQRELGIQPGRDSITVTQLAGCPRASYLGYRYDHYVDLEQLCYETYIEHLQGVRSGPFCISIV